MSEALITRRGGGGAELNFSVVGGTMQPARPKENTIWVNTDQEITGWSFSATEPTESVNGMVWIETSDLDVYMNFNALSNNQIELRVVSVYQRILGVWEKQTAWLYQDDNWFILDGNILVRAAFGVAATHGTKYTYHLPTQSEPYITITTLYENSTQQGKLILATMEPIDLSKVSRIAFVIDSWTLGNTSYPLCLAAHDKWPTYSTETSFSASVKRTTSISEKTTISLDVSGLNDKNGYYILIKSEGSYNPIITTGGTISEIILE